MFNKTVSVSIDARRSSAPISKTVKVIKAPTDASIRLLNEFKEKALKDSLKVFYTDNFINTVVSVSKNNLTDGFTVYVYFKINNVDYTKKKELVHSPSKELHNEVIKLVRDMVSEFLVSNICVDIFSVINPNRASKTKPTKGQE